MPGLMSLRAWSEEKGRYSAGEVRKAVSIFKPGTDVVILEKEVFDELFKRAWQYEGLMK